MEDNELSRLQLELIAYERDRQQIFEMIVSRPLIMSAMTADRTHLRFRIHKIERSQMFLELQLPAPRRPVASETLTLTFGLDEGQYFIKGVLQPVAGDMFALPIGEKLYRLQRRNNFRAPVPESMKAVFRMRKKEGSLVDHELHITDISGGGLGLLVPKGRSLPAVPGDEVVGRLEMKDQQPLQLEGVIRHIWPPDVDGQVKVGLQCHHLTPETERELVAICMKIHRELFSLFRNLNR